MNNEVGNDDSRIIISRNKKVKGKFSELKIDRYGRLFIDGQIYDENSPIHKGLFVSIERHRKVNAGEETQRMIEEGKKAEKGETVVITDEKTPIRTEKTTVKF